MSLPHLFRSLIPLTSLAAVLLAAVPGNAQSLRIPPGTRGFKSTMMIQEYQRYQRHQAELAAQSPVVVTRTYQTAPSVVNVDINVPEVAVPVSSPGRIITLRGPDGEVRRFPLARGVEVRYTRRHVSLRPGESTTIQLVPVY